MSEEEREFPDCMICQDTGIHGGAERPFAFCLCKNGIARQLAEPELVDESNTLRFRLGIS